MPPRSGPRAFAASLCVALFASSSTGCDLGVRSFAGAIVQMTITGATPTAPSQHLELWARTQYDDVVRVDHLYADPTGAESGGEAARRRYGFVIRDAIRMNDPCMIDDAGALLTTAAAYDDAVIAGVQQTAEDQAAAVRARIAQLTSTNNCAEGLPDPSCGAQATSLYAMVPYSPKVDPTPLVGLSPVTPADERLERCRAYWGSHPLAYTPNPTQIISPLHGTVVGFLDYTTPVPVAGYDSIRIETSLSLKGLRELFLTVETREPGEAGDGVDPLHRGPVFLAGTPTPAGRGVLFLDLNGPTASGTALVQAELDDDGIGF